MICVCVCVCVCGYYSEPAWIIHIHYFSYFRCEAQWHAQHGSQCPPPNVYGGWPRATDGAASLTWTTLGSSQYTFLQFSTSCAALITAPSYPSAWPATWTHEALCLPYGHGQRTSKVTASISKYVSSFECPLTA